jgi:site-specific DNA-methyltransferase (adenine-specific)/adenine-specific DNA-methyltransferase
MEWPFRHLPASHYTAPHTYTKAGRYTVAVKVIDIFGNDTMVLVPVIVR